MNHRFLIGAFALAAATLAATGASAQGFPNRQVTILVGQQPGGPTDTLTRMVAAHLKDALGQPVVVENKPGAGTNLAAETMLQAKPDGHVLFVGGLGPFTVNDILYSKLAFKPERDFALIAILGRTPHVFAVNPEVPAKTLAEFVAYAKANPGKTNYGSPGVGTAPHFASVMFMLRVGFEAAHVAYRGGPLMMDAVTKNEVQWAFDAPLSVMGPSRDGRVRPIAVSAPVRSPQFPDVPTFAELGMPEVDMYAWFALAAPAGTPEATIARLNAETIRAMGMPEAKQRLANLGLESPGLSPAQVAEFAAGERRRLSEIARKGNMKVE